MIPVKPRPFRYHRPSNVDEAVDILADDDATVLAGGQSLIPMMNTRLADPGTVVDIGRIDELEYIREDEETVAIGAMTPQATAEDSDVIAEHCPLVAEALTYLGHETIRNRGTIGGNLAHGDPTSELPAVALARDATFVVQDSGDERTVDADDFFISHMTTDIGPTELLTEVRFPKWPQDQGWSFEEIAPRKGDYALVGVAATLQIDDGDTCEEVRLAYTAVDHCPVRIPAAEEAVRGEPADEDTFWEAGAIARENLDPPSDVHASSEYRSRVAGTLTTRALSQAVDRTEA